MTMSKVQLPLLQVGELFTAAGGASHVTLWMPLMFQVTVPPLVMSTRAGSKESPGVVTVATRLPVGLSRHGGWGDTTLSLDGHSWTEVFTNTSYGGNRLAVEELLRTYPVALLVKEQ